METKEIDPAHSNPRTLLKREKYLPFGRPCFSDLEIEAVTRVMRSGWVSMGPETRLFESELAQYLGVPEVVAVNSCTAGLFLSLLASGVSKHDEVICPSLTWCSSSNTALYLGAKPVFCEVDPETWCLDLNDVRVKLSPKTKAVVVVHFGGKAADVSALRKILPAHVAIIEDAAHAFGATYFSDSSLREKRVGASGNLTCFSFYANKNLSTGEGGAIAVNDSELAERLRSLRHHGLPSDAWKRFNAPRANLSRTQISELGYKLVYNDLGASIGRVQLKRFPEFQATRLAVAQVYRDRVPKLIPGVKFQADLLDPGHARHLVSILLPEGFAWTRDEFLLALQDRQVGASVHYNPVHRMPLYERRFGKVSLPITEAITERILTLPIGSGMTVEDTHFVCDTLEQLIESRTN